MRQQLLLVVKYKLTERVRPQLQYKIVRVFEQHDAVDEQNLVVLVDEVAEVHVGLDVVNVERDELISFLQELDDLFILLLFEFLSHQVLQQKI